MPGPAMMTPAQSAPKDASQPATIAVPFVRAATEHVESFLDVSLVQTASTQQISPVDLPAYGFVRGIYIEVTASGGVGTAVLKADAPFSFLQDIALIDVNGQPIVGPISGFDLYLIDKYGGYRRGTINPKRSPDFASGTNGGNVSFLLYLPLECGLRDGLGSLANLNAASSYKLRLTLAASTDQYATAPTTLPTVRTRAWLDTWTQPDPVDTNGNPQAVEPPAHGTTSFWSKQVTNITQGQQTVRHQRVGNYFRNLIYVFRDASGVRNRVNFPPNFQMYWDTRLLKEYGGQVWRSQMSQRYNLDGADESANGLDVGVYVEDYTHEFDGLPGAELRDGWLPTVQATRFEVQALFGAPGTLGILTNDVAPVGQVFI